MKQRIEIIMEVVKSKYDVDTVQHQVEDLLNKYKGSTVTWLTSAGKTFNIITAIVTWNE